MMNVKRVLHESRFASVYIESDIGGTPFVVKRVSHSDAIIAARTKNEIDALKRFAHGSDFVHPFLIKMRWASQNQHETLISLDLCEQGDLLEYMQNSSLCPRTIKYCLMELGLAIDHLHSKLGIIHEDLKPENIGISSDGHVRLLDFGISTFVTVDVAGHYAEVLCSQGTVEYASPEKILRQPHSFDADWWSFGVIAFELYFGQLPWSEETTDATVQAICSYPIELIQIVDGSPMEDKDALNFFHSLLTLQKQCRLSYGGGFDAICRHPFLESIDVHDVLSLKYPPFGAK